MKTTAYEGEIQDRATSSDSLRGRLDLNRKYQSLDFPTWLFEHIDVAEGADLLDVGCGTGVQSLEFARLVGGEGRVCAVDLSADSIAALNANPEKSPNLTAGVGNMADLAAIITEQFPVQRFDIVHSAYALYYAPDPKAVLGVMLGALKPAGRLYVSAPVRPHGMV